MGPAVTSAISASGTWLVEVPRKGRYMNFYAIVMSDVDKQPFNRRLIGSFEIFDDKVPGDRVSVPLHQ